MHNRQHFSALTLVQSSLFLLLLVLLLFFEHSGWFLSGALAFAALIGCHFFIEYRLRDEPAPEPQRLIIPLLAYLLLCTLVVWLTRGEEESPLWIVYFLPIIFVASYADFKATLWTCTASLFLFVSHLPPHMYLQQQAQREALPELLGFGIMFFLVGTLVQNFARRNRLQLEKTRQLNEQLLRNQQHLQDSLTRLESAEKSLRAKERLASLGELSAGIAHEIRNPLGIISSSAQMLEHEVSDPAAGQLLDIIQEESTRLNSLITDFLFFGRQLEPNLADCDLGALICRDVDSLQSSAEHKGVSISFSNFCSPCLVQVDAGMIRQVLLNLLLNALDATDAGGKVTVTLQEKDAQALIMVADNGCGIPPEHREKVFDPFFTTKGGGTGLGLANSFKIIQSHGGELVLESAVGAGSCFTVQLPLKGGD